MYTNVLTDAEERKRRKSTHDPSQTDYRIPGHVSPIELSNGTAFLVHGHTLSTSKASVKLPKALALLHWSYEGRQHEAHVVDIIKDGGTG